MEVLLDTNVRPEPRPLLPFSFSFPCIVTPLYGVLQNIVGMWGGNLWGPIRPNSLRLLNPAVGMRVDRTAAHPFSGDLQA